MPHRRSGASIAHCPSAEISASAPVTSDRRKAGNLSTLFSASIGAAAATAHSAADKYGQTEMVNAGNFHGRP